MAKKKLSKTGLLLKKMNGTSNLEVRFGKILTNLGIKHTPHFVFKGREYDFLLDDYKILVEIHGCFFHCCKTHHPLPKYRFQRNNLKNDKTKAQNVKFDPNYILMIIWEHEMMYDKQISEVLIKKFKLVEVIKN